MGFTDDKDASRTIRTGFMNVIVVSHDTQEFTERRFLMNKSLYKGHQAWLSQIALSAVLGDPVVIFGNLQLCCKCLTIYFVGIYSESEILRCLFFLLRKFVIFFFCKMPPKKRTKRRGSQERETMSMRTWSPDLDELSCVPET